MSAKYSEQGVVRLKRETERLSAEIHDLLEKKAQIEKEIPKKDEALEEKRRIFRDFDDMVAVYFESKRNEERQLANRIKRLTEEAAKHASVLSVLRDGISSFEVPVPVTDFSYVEQVKTALKAHLDGLESSIESKEEEKKALENSYRDLSVVIDQLRSEKENLEPKLVKLKADIIAGNDKNGKLGKAYIELQEKIVSIETRERESRVMQERLTPEYLAIYKSVPNSRLPRAKK